MKPTNKQARNAVQDRLNRAAVESRAYKMISDGYTPTMVSASTGLTVQAIEEIRRQHGKVEIAITSGSAKDMFRRATHLLEEAERAALQLLQGPDVTARDINAAINVVREMRAHAGLESIKAIVAEQSESTIETELVSRKDVLIGMLKSITDTSDA